MNSFKNVSVHELDQFVKRSTVADTKRDTARFLLYFMHTQKVHHETKQFIKTLLHDEALLEKIVVVNEADYYETVLELSDSRCCDTTLYRLYKNQAETIFLHVTVDNAEHEKFENWLPEYNESQQAIIDFLLDEYLLLKKWHKLLPSHAYKQASDKWQNVLTLIQQNNDEEEKDR